MQKSLKNNARYIAMIVILLAVMFIYIARMFYVQVINADKYLAQASSVSTRNVTVKAARGEILDRFGRALAINREGYNIVLNNAYLKEDMINPIIKTLTVMLDNAGEEWVEKLPLAPDEPFGFTADESAVKIMKAKLQLAHYSTPQNCFDRMVELYKLEGLDRITQRRLMGIRYSMQYFDFSIANPYTFAEDISSDTMTRILESNFDLPGVEIDVVPIREYPDPSIAPNILGTMGPIYAEDWEKLKDKGYSLGDKLGKSGIEGYAEDYLKGTDGTRQIKTDASGNILSTQITKEPIAGNTVILGLDKKLQRVAQDALANLVRERSAQTGGKANSGACVAVEIKSGEVLLSANYPSYTLNDYYDNYEILVQDENKPLFDRAFAGQYPPGSSFKPAIALASLNEAVIEPSSTICCVHTYSRFKDYRPTCLGYHGYINVVTALSQSCNYFFFDCGFNLGIDKIDSYCKQLGLGVPTGVEISEATGVIDGPEYRESISTPWYGGDVLQTAIGQANNAFSPLQLAAYTATLANGGVRNQTKLIHEVRSYSLEEIIVDSVPKVLNTLELKSGVLDVVKTGMLSVTEDGTGSGTFGTYAIKVGGKTGTATNAKGGDNSVFIAFAPYENPEIAVAVIIENGGHGSENGVLVKEIFDAYFFAADSSYTEPAIGRLLK